MRCKCYYIEKKDFILLHLRCDQQGYSAVLKECI